MSYEIAVGVGNNKATSIASSKSFNLLSDLHIHIPNCSNTGYFANFLKW